MSAITVTSAVDKAGEIKVKIAKPEFPGIGISIRRKREGIATFDPGDTQGATVAHKHI